MRASRSRGRRGGTRLTLRRPPARAATPPARAATPRARAATPPARPFAIAALGVACLLGLVWTAPRVSAAVSTWMTTPPTKAKLVTVACTLRAVGSGAAAPEPIPAASPRSAGPPSAAVVGQRAADAGGPVSAAGDTARASGVVDAGFRFNMVAVLLDSAVPYDRRVTVRLRWSLDGSTWSAWQPVGFVRSEGRPGSVGDAASTCSEPLWVGDARFVQYTVAVATGGDRPAQVSRVRFSFINTKGDADTADSVVGALKSGLATIAGVCATPAAYSLAQRPPIVMRSQWGADESLRSGSPSYATVRMVFVHHTAGGNSYTQAESPAIVRGIYYYHTRIRGWSDIGYNFLVDKYGTIYEGRYGGVTKGVIGAQVLGFNTHSCGVSIMGTYDAVRPSGAAVYSLEKLLAWKLDLNHVDPLGTATMICGTTERFRAGQTVTFPVIAGHRQAGYTSCPGNAAYGLLPEIRAAVAQRGEPKIYAPWTSLMAFSPDGDSSRDSVEMGGTLSERAAWTVRIKDAQGAVVRSFAGEGTTIAATWDGRDETGRRVPDGAYTLVMSGSNDHGVTRAATIGVTVDTVDPVVSGVGATAVASPNGDGIDDGATIAYTTSEAGSARVRLYDSAGRLVRTVEGWTAVPAGSRTVVWDGRVTSSTGLVPAPNGTYAAKVALKDAAGNVGNASGTVIVNLTLGFPKAKPLYFSPNADGTRDTSDLTFALTRSATVTVTVSRPTGVVRTIALGPVAAGREKAVWDGLNDAGLRVGSGRFTFTVTAANALGKVSASAKVTLDRYVPVASVPATRTVRYGSRVKIRYTVKDPYSRDTRDRFFVKNKAGDLLKTIDAGWETAGVAHTVSYKPPRRGTFTITLIAADRAGNVAPPCRTTVTVT